MDGKFIRKKGFTLLEVIISMAIISIVSVGIHTGYMIMIRQTKDGQVKQEAALEGKKVAEALEATDFTIGDSNSIRAGTMTFNKVQTAYIRYLNKEYHDSEDDKSEVTENTAKYIESVTFSPTIAITDRTDKISEPVKLNTNNNLNSVANKIYISRSKTGDYISYPQIDQNESKISLLSLSSNSLEMELSIYLTPIDEDTSNENINVIDYTGNSLITATKKISDNLVLNFSNYKNADGTLPSNENIEINVYSQISAAANIYLEKQTGLNVDLENRKGEVNLYNNRAENVSQDDIGSLYDIKINITDNNTKDNLFTGYYKKNLK